MDANKICPHCGIQKDASEYYKSQAKGGLYPYCIACCIKKYRDRNPMQEPKYILKDPTNNHWCKRCEKEMPKNKFYYRNKSKGTLLANCIECTRVMNNQPTLKKTTMLRPIDETNNKICITCKIEKPKSEFYFRKDTQVGASARCKECDRIHKKEYRKTIRQELNKKDLIKYRTDPSYREKNKIRARLSHVLRYHKKCGRTEELLGCSMDYFIKHIESQFVADMTWDNTEIDHIVPCVTFNLAIPEEQKKCFNYTNLQPLYPTTRVINGVTYIGNRNKSTANIETIV